MRHQRYFNRVNTSNSWTAQEFMQRIGRTPTQQKYYNRDGSVKQGYSTNQGQSNSNPVYTHTGYNSAPQNVYKVATPQPAPAPAPAPAPQAPPVSRPQAPQSPNYDTRINDIQNANTAATDALMAQLAADRQNYESMLAKFEQQISSYKSAFNQGTSVGGEKNALQINPAEPKADKKKRVAKGTQQFNRDLKISNVSI